MEGDNFIWGLPPGYQIPTSDVYRRQDPAIAPVAPPDVGTPPVVLQPGQMFDPDAPGGGQVLDIPPLGAGARTGTVAPTGVDMTQPIDNIPAPPEQPIRRPLVENELPPLTTTATTNVAPGVTALPPGVRDDASAGGNLLATQSLLKGIDVPIRDTVTSTEPTSPRARSLLGFPQMEGVDTRRTDADIAALQRGAKQGEQTLDQIADAQRTSAMDEVKARMEQQVMAKAEARRMKDMAEERRAIYEKWQSDDKTYQDQMDSIKPVSFFDQSGTATGVLSNIGKALAVGLGALGSHLTGHTNVVLNLLDKSLQDDINAQKMQLAKITNQRQMSKNRLAQAIAMYGDVNLAESAAYRAGLSAVDRYIDGIIANEKVPMAKANAELLKQKIQEKMNTIKLDDDQQVEKRLDAHMRFKYRTLGPQYAAQAHQEELQRMIDDQEPGWEAALIQSKIPNKQQQLSALKEVGFIQDLKKSMGSIASAYDTIAKTSGVLGNVPFTATKAAADAARSSIMAAIQSSWKGPLSDRDTKLMEPILPNVTDTKQQIEEKLKRMLVVIKSNSKPTPTLRAYGLVK